MGHPSLDFETDFEILKFQTLPVSTTVDFDPGIDCDKTLDLQVATL
jgi:hypothetical protein